MIDRFEEVAAKVRRLCLRENLDMPKVPKFSAEPTYEEMKEISDRSREDMEEAIKQIEGSAEAEEKVAEEVEKDER